jgi:hypothetical protein
MVQKHIAFPCTLSLLALLTPPLKASCVRLQGPRHLEAEVVTCEAPRARATQEFNKHRTVYAYQKEDPASLLEGILKNAPPSQVMSLKVLRFQQLPKDAEGSMEDLIGVPWTKEGKPEVKEYLVAGVASCAEYPPGKPARFFERFTCCDVVPALDLECLVGLPVLVPSQDAG